MSDISPSHTAGMEGIVDAVNTLNGNDIYGRGQDSDDLLSWRRQTGCHGAGEVSH